MFRRMPRLRYLQPPDTRSLPRVTTASCASSCAAGEPRRLRPHRSGISSITQKLRAPICFNPVASRTVLPLQELRASLGMEGKAPDQIAEGVQTAYAKGELPKMEAVAFAYMFSADQDLGPGVGPWHPHMMLYTPYYENSMLGGNQIGGMLPFVGDDAGTPFAVTVIPVAHALAVKTQVK